jgi:hypothetical protein
VTFIIIGEIGLILLALEIPRRIVFLWPRARRKGEKEFNVMILFGKLAF